jgi:hypothetical protein
VIEVVCCVGIGCGDHDEVCNTITETVYTGGELLGAAVVNHANGSENTDNTSTSMPA